MIDNDYLHDALRFLQTNRAFLGREFLTWLWFVSESEKHKLEIPEVGNFHFFVDDKIVLSAAGGSVHESALKGGTPAYATEARTALLSGKLVDEMKFILQDEDRQWLWTMKAEDLSLRGVRLPAVHEAHAQAHMVERIGVMRVLVDVIDHLFKRYMAVRMSPKLFENELELMRDWMQSKVSHQS